MSASVSTPRPAWWERVTGLVAWGWTSIVFVLLWMPPPPPPDVIIWWYDKAVHAALLAGFGGLWTWAGRRGRWVIGWGVALGAVTEIGQGLLPWERNSSLGDFAADLGGLALGWLAGRLVWPPRVGARPPWW